MRARAGWTLIELLVVIAVIGIVAGLLLPAVAAARRHSQQAPCISNLRQIGHAYAMYLQDYGRPAEPLDALVDAGVLRDTRLLACPLDPTATRVWGSAINDEQRRSLHRSPYRGYVSHYPSSYIYIHSIVPGAVRPRESAFITSRGTYGIAACQLHGKRIALSRDRPWLLDYEGLVLRLQNDGSVVRRHVTWARSEGGHRIVGSYLALFLDGEDLKHAAEIRE